MRYQVPQFVDIEDKIVGPLTLRQFLIYCAGVFVCIPIYLTCDMSLFITLMVPIIAVAALFAHFHLNGKTLFQVITYAITYFSRGRLYIWRRLSTDFPLRITGPEFGDFSLDTTAILIQDIDKSRPTSLAAQAQIIETTGRIIQDDMPDPMMTIPSTTPLAPA